jgi:hypothetical protein
VIVDADMDELPTNAAAVALASAVAGDAVANLIEPAELFDVDMDQFAGTLALVSALRLRRLQAAQHRLPAVYPFRYFATGGGLMSYGIDIVDLFRRAAGYVDKILRGANPGDLPVQQPDRFEFVINLTTVKALGLSVPRILLAGAEVIE